MMPGPGGAAAAGGGVWPPVGGPFCAIASELPLTSSAMTARLFRVVIVTSNALSRAHPDTHMERPYHVAVPASGDKRMAANYERPLIVMSQKRPRLPRP